MPDKYRVNITTRAQSDLDEIFDYIRQESPQNASEVVEQILNAAEDLEFMPARFRVAGRSKTSGETVHARVVRPFIVYYRIDESNREVFVIHVRRGARRQPRRFD